MQLALDPHGAPRHQQIYEAMRAAILSGTIQAGQRLPSSRALARDVGVSRTTVLGAFERLLTEGYVTGRAGAGTRVAAEPPVVRFSPARNSARPINGAVVSDPPPTLSIAASSLLEQGKWRHMPTQPVPFTAGIPALDVFPLATWTRLNARRWRQSGRELLLAGDPRGYEPLRSAVAQYVAAARGVKCTADQVLIVNGAQHAIDLCARMLVNPGDAVWLENPCYPPARGIFAATGAQLIDVPVDDNGMDVAAGRALAPSARLAFLTPSYHSPLGVTLSLERRYALIEWARDAGSWIVEDDYNGEYRYDASPVPAMQGLDADGRVLYIGSFSKSFAPGMRLGYLIVPPSLVAHFSQARMLLDRHSPVPEQAALADFIAGGHFARHIRRTKAVHQERQRVFLNTAARELDGLLTFNELPAGMRLLGWLPPGSDDVAISEEAARRGVVVAPLSRQLEVGSERRGFMFGYAAYSAAQTRVALRVLAQVIRSQR
jgi:GntR family transcriptional regulator/MocR family aminotransferase